MFTLNTEIWKDIPGYEGYYQASNFGRIKSLHRNKEKILKAYYDKDGYLAIELNKQGVAKKYRVHRLIAITFVPIPQKYLDKGYTYEDLQINHKDENKENNCIENLEWCTSEYNIQYGNSIVKRSHGVTQFSLDGSFIKNWIHANAAGKELNIDPSGILKVCNGKMNTAGGFLWRYTQPYYNEEYNLNVSDINTTGTTAKMISQFDKEGNFIKTWPSIAEAARVLKLDPANINKCCQGKSTICGGCLWRYYIPEYTTGYKLMIEHLNLTERPLTMSVDMFDIEGLWIKNFNSINEAARIMNIDAAHICDCCKGKIQTSGGYIWRYHLPEYKEGYRLDMSNIQSMARRVSMFNANGDYIKTFDSAVEAAKELNLKTVDTVGKCCRGTITQSSTGYIFRFYNPIFKEGYNLFQIDFLDIISKPVHQIDIKTNNIVATYPNIQTAYSGLKRLQAGINGWQNIYQCCNGLLPIAFGYKWEFVK